MLVNPDKFQAILLDKQKLDYTGTKLTVGSEEIQVVYSVDVLDVTIGTKHSRMDEVKNFWKTAFKKFEGIWLLKQTISLQIF